MEPGRFTTLAVGLAKSRYRYLLPDEEPRLLAQRTGKRKHLATMIPFAIGTGARKREQLRLMVRQCDFFRNLIIFDRTKSDRPRFVEMNSEVREILLPLCKSKRPDDHVWLNPKTGIPFDLRATYGTRLGEAGFNAYDIAS